MKRKNINKLFPDKNFILDRTFSSAYRHIDKNIRTCLSKIQT